MRSKLLSLVASSSRLRSLTPSPTTALLCTPTHVRLIASAGGPNYFPGLSRKKTEAAAAAHNNHLSPMPGGRRHSLHEADALAARRWAFPRTSMSDPSQQRGPLTATVHVVEGGPAVSTPGFFPHRSSVADPEWLATPLPDHRAPP